MNRRTFLTTSALTALGASTLGVAACNGTPDAAERDAAGAATDRRPFAMGVQLYTLRTLLDEDVPGTLAALGAIGYEEVETAGYHGLSPADFRAALDAAGLRAPAGHRQLDQLTPDALPQTLDEAQALGYEYVVCPWIQEANRQTLDDYRALADTFNAIGSRCAEAGLQFAFHNHDFEFEAIDGTVPYDVLLERTDPALVGYELDLFWVVAAGFDPVTYLEAHPGRFPLYHVKDYAPDNDPSMVAVGAGTIPFADIFEAAQAQGPIAHAFVEHDNPSDPLTSVTDSYTYLSTLFN